MIQEKMGAMLNSLMDFLSAPDSGYYENELLNTAKQAAQTHSEHEAETPLSILFIGEYHQSENYQKIADTLSKVSKILPSSWRLDYKFLRSFLGNKFPKLRETRLNYSGYTEFKTWLINHLANNPNKNLLHELRTACKKTELQEKEKKTGKKNKKEKEQEQDKKEAFYEELYEELCLLASYGAYKTSDHIIKEKDSLFKIGLHASIKNKIENILTEYRHWMNTEHKLNLALSNLSNLLTSPYKKTSEKKEYTHTLWKTTQKISPNIEKFLRETTDNIEDISSHKIASIPTDIDSETSTVLDEDLLKDEVDNFIEKLEQQYRLTLNDDEKDLLEKPEFVKELLSTEKGKNTLIKILVIDPLITEKILHRYPAETLIAFGELVTEEKEKNIKSIHFIIIKKTMHVFSTFVTAYLHLQENDKKQNKNQDENNKKSLKVILEKMICQSLGDLETFKLLCLPENHQLFLALFFLDFTKSPNYYWKKISVYLENSTEQSPLFSLLHTIYGFAILKQLIETTSPANIKIILMQASTELMHKNFTSRTINIAGISYPQPAFFDLLDATKFIASEFILLTQPSLKETLESLDQTLTLLLTSSTRNQWSSFMKSIFSSIIVAISNYMKCFPTVYWENKSPKFPWYKLRSLTTACLTHAAIEENHPAIESLSKRLKDFTLTALSNDETLTELHEKIKDDPSHGKYFSAVVIDHLSKQENISPQEFLNKSMHPDRHLPLFSIIGEIDISDKKQEGLALKLFNHLGDHLQNLTLTSLNNNLIMHQKLLKLFTLHSIIKLKTSPNELIAKIIFDLILFFANKIFDLNSTNLLLYKEIFQAFATTPIKNKDELRKIFTLFEKIYGQVLMHKNTENDWETIREIYLVICLRCLETYNFSGCYNFAIKVYSMIDKHLTSSPELNDEFNHSWGSILYYNIWMSIISEFVVAEKNNADIEEEFFPTVFEFSQQCKINNNWPDNQVKRILSALIDFFIYSMKYSLVRHSQEPHAISSWEKPRLLFNQTAFSCRKECLAITEKINSVIELAIAYTEETPSEITKKFSEITALQADLDQSCDESEPPISLTNSANRLSSLQPSFYFPNQQDSTPYDSTKNAHRPKLNIGYNGN